MTTDLGQTLLDVMSADLQRIRKGLEKEGAGLDVDVDVSAQKVTVSLVRHRITCEGCLLPADLVKTMLTKSLKTHPEGRRFAVETENWLSSP